MTRTTAAALAASLVGAVAVTGCTSSSTPKANYSTAVSSSPASATTSSPAPTGIPTTGPNVQPGETPPSLGPDANAEGSDSAQAFALYYFKLIDWAYASNDTTFLQTAQSSSCASCKQLVDNIRSVSTGGYSVHGVRTTIKQIATVSNDGRGGAAQAVDGVLDVSAGQVLDASGSVVRTLDAQNGVTITLWLAYVDAGWRVVDQAQV